jgi:hypothetical protein
MFIKMFLIIISVMILSCDASCKDECVVLDNYYHSHTCYSGATSEIVKIDGKLIVHCKCNKLNNIIDASVDTTPAHLIQVEYGY